MKPPKDPVAAQPAVHLPHGPLRKLTLRREPRSTPILRPLRKTSGNVWREYDHVKRRRVTLVGWKKR